MIYEVLMIEDNTYYVKLYEDREAKGVTMKMTKEEFNKFIINKKER